MFSPDPPRQAVAGAIFYARASNRLPPDLPSQNSGPSIDYSLLRSIQPLTLRWQVLHVVSSSIQVSSAAELCPLPS